MLRGRITACAVLGCLAYLLDSLKSLRLKAHGAIPLAAFFSVSEGLARVFFERVKGLADWRRLTSSEHFSVDGTLIDAWASHKSLRPRDGDGPRPPERNPEVDFKGRCRTHETHVSTTDPQARLFKKAEGTASRLCYMSHVRIENRNGLVVDVATTLATGKAERQAALNLARYTRRAATVGADKGYVTAASSQAVGRHAARGAEEDRLGH